MSKEIKRKFKYSISPMALFAIILFAGFTLSLIVNVFLSGEVINTVFFDQGRDTGMDFFNSIAYTVGQKPYSQFGTLYPALANLFFFIIFKSLPFSSEVSWGNSFLEVLVNRNTASGVKASPFAIFIFIVFIIVVIILLFYFISKSINGKQWEKNLFSTSMMISVVVLWAFERGNIIFLSLFGVMFFIKYRNSTNRYLSEMALIALALAAGLKLYPAIFGVLVLIDKQYTKALRLVIYGVVIFFVPFVFFEGLNGFLIFIEILFGFSEVSLNSLGGFSLTEILRSFLVISGVTVTGDILGVCQTIAHILSLCLIIFAIFSKEEWKKLALITIVTIIFPSKSGYYSLIFLIPALIMYLNNYDNTKITHKIYFVLFLLLFTFLPYIDLEFFKNFGDTNYTFFVFQMQLYLLLVVVVIFLDCLFEMVCLVLGNIKLSKSR